MFFVLAFNPNLIFLFDFRYRVEVVLLSISLVLWAPRSMAPRCLSNLNLTSASAYTCKCNLGLVVFE